jgi:glucan 1,3-beta-glucosidase
MKPLQVLAHLSGLYQLSDAYNTPAPPDATLPNPFAYFNWTPANPVHGFFSGKNNSVAPWHPEPHQPPHLSPHQQCSVSNSNSQSRFWLPNVAHTGTSPFLLNAPNYHIYRNVKDFGAVGDGVHDDTDAFNAAIDCMYRLSDSDVHCSQYPDGSRCAGGQCPGGSTGKPALIYVPPGTYAIFSTIQLYINTQMIGDAIDLPTLKAAPSALNNTVVVNGYDRGTQSTNNFYIGFRNFNIDTTVAAPDKTIYALNWAVSQATNLINVHFNMPVDSNHIGIEMDGQSSGGGSGLFMGDLTFSGGLIGLRFNNQQYSLKNLKFTNVGTAIAVTHGFIISMQQINCVNVGICVDMGAQGVTGSLSLIDSWCDTCGVVVNGSSSVVLENIDVKHSGPLLVVNGTTKAQGNLVGKTYISGHVYKGGNGRPIVSNGTKEVYPDRGSLADASGRYFTKSQPQYTQYPASAFASVKDAGAKGKSSYMQLFLA